MDSWRVQEAVKQTRSRALNESVAKSSDTSGAENGFEVFSCECGDPGCNGHVSLSAAEYESVRAHPDRFVLVANHENPEVERIVAEEGRFTVIATLAGEASKVALRNNPRRLM